MPLEKHADMLISDNVKKAGVCPPPGSYSWKWIDTSHKNGILEDKNDYLIQTEATLVGISRRTKPQRTPFSTGDDALLTKFVMACESSSKPMTKEQMWRDLARRVRPI